MKNKSPTEDAPVESGIAIGGIDYNTGVPSFGSGADWVNAVIPEKDEKDKESDSAKAKETNEAQTKSWLSYLSAPALPIFSP